MGEQKKRRGRRAYLDDFQKTVTGEYVYTGKTHRWTAKRGRTLAQLWLYAVVCFAACFSGGCISDTRMETRPWSLLPFVVALLLSGAQCWSMYRLTDAGDPIRDYDWKASVQRLPVLALLTAIFAGAAFLAELIGVVFLPFDGKLSAAALFMGGQAVTAAAALLLRRTVKRLEWA